MFYFGERGGGLKERGRGRFEHHRKEKSVWPFHCTDICVTCGVCALEHSRGCLPLQTQKSVAAHSWVLHHISHLLATYHLVTMLGGYEMVTILYLTFLCALVYTHFCCQWISMIIKHMRDSTMTTMYCVLAWHGTTACWMCIFDISMCVQCCSLHESFNECQWYYQIKCL